MAISSPHEKMSLQESLKTLDVDPKKGLSKQEVIKRLTLYGKNAVSNKKESLFYKFIKYLNGPIPWLIELAALLSALLGRWPDFTLIVFLLCLNTFLGFFHEYQADHAIEALKDKLALKAKVLRDGIWKVIPAEELVPGDIISLKLGNIIPADVKLIEGDYLSVDQSALTGESLPVDKQQNAVAFCGTMVKKGEMATVVTETGMKTFFGKTASLLSNAKSSSHLEQAITHIGRFLIIATLSLATIIFIASLAKMEFDHNFHHSLGQIAIFLLVVIVAGIPVALPAVMSVTMAIGASSMSKLKAIVSKLSAIEELASMDILCSDKTGTLTKNLLTVKDVIPSQGVHLDEVLFAAALTTKENDGDSIDDAILAAVKQKDQLTKCTLKHFVPFDPVSKRAESTIEKDGITFQVTKGAVQVVLNLVQIKEEDKSKINQQVEECAKHGFRTLAVAKNTGSNWEYLGLIALFDPPRDDTKKTLMRIYQMGSQVKMVTGDHRAIAEEISHTIGLGPKIASADDVLKQSTPDLESYDGFAEVYPEHKYAVVKELQKKNHVVGMTGDGVNDAPALKAADIGIAVSGATDAARASADLILTQPGLMVITHAIEESRKIFGRLKSYAMYRISETVRLLLFLLFAILFLDEQPLNAVMIILIAVLNDIPIMAIAYDHMQVPPKPTRWNMTEVFFVATGLACMGVVSTFLLYLIGLNYWNLSPHECSTLAFMGILCGGNLTIYLTRTPYGIFQRPMPQSGFMLATLFSQMIGTLLSVYGLYGSDFIGIGWVYVGYSWIYILGWFVFLCFFKTLLVRLLYQHQT